jgi:hypothetical protein
MTDSRTSKEWFRSPQRFFLDAPKQPPNTCFVLNSDYTEAVNEVARLQRDLRLAEATVDQAIKRAERAERAGHEPCADAAALLEAYDACWIEDERLCFMERGPKGNEAKAMREQFNKARAAVLAAMRPAQPPSVCKWEPEESDACDLWSTGCGEAHVFEAGDPAENDYKFCPYCGDTVECSGTTKSGEQP